MFHGAATDDGSHASLYVAMYFYAAITTIQNLPLIDRIVVWVPFFFELKLLVVAILSLAGGSQLCYTRFVVPAFRRLGKTPEELAANLPSGLRTKYDTSENLNSFAAKVVETTPTIVAEHGVASYRIIMAMLIQSAKTLELNGQDATNANSFNSNVSAATGFYERVMARFRGRRDQMIAGAIKTSIEAGIGGSGDSI